jgi:ABC-type Zn2+ transport system substrate-binding protein/surface adhesin
LENSSDYTIHARWNRLLLMAALDKDSETVCSLWAKIRNSPFYTNKNAYGYAEKLENLNTYLTNKGYTCFE